MNNNLTVACLQMSVAWRKEEKNIENVMRAIDRLSVDQPHFICLPELFTTGFDYDYLQKRDAERTWEVLEKIAEKAKAKKSYILAGTLPEPEGEHVYNTLFVLNPYGERIASYRKIHLFPLIGEDRFFHAGENTLVFQTPWARIGVAICYDLRFPELFHKMALDGAEIIFVPAHFPAARIDHWDILLKARAIENQVFVAGVNRIGYDPFSRFSGHTCIIDPMGKMRAGGGEEEGWVTGGIDLQMLNCVRVELPTLFHSNK
ncbi:MAG: carbon-nitrogen family hydrolase [bacterium]